MSEQSYILGKSSSYKEEEEYISPTLYESSSHKSLHSLQNKIICKKSSSISLSNDYEESQQEPLNSKEHINKKLIDYQKPKNSTSSKSSSSKSSGSGSKSPRILSISAIESYKKVMNDLIEPNLSPTSNDRPIPLKPYTPKKKQIVRKYNLDLFRSDSDDSTKDSNGKKPVGESRYLAAHPDKSDPFYNTDRTIDDVTTIIEEAIPLQNKSLYADDTIEEGHCSPTPLQIGNNQYLDMTMTTETGIFFSSTIDYTKKRHSPSKKLSHNELDQNSKVKQSKYLEELTTQEQ
ncbi:hypothetical protein TVAG_373870 [Trichomonas vaginalis G3]|uniref:Uncharacterized protein n=1 Tax=Trichomonas vaginalis (strain ATCC PRA-98 / G3) TaxID=412133 RepID=A2EBR8_TRIV3|nr:hypothetical protein TVAGG3_0464630 [Trichomonas vaginalis G3]EAY09880.1 hypothetical protein TVAG_373870 [Trichomonas vaginalis G3]KAI5514682.1 hypothetical protein TVAGG3_0464630 [Trichomonas vaginalis G3]|eukprot:XP_001322103.1 hypothetical protein [Trichomonas vaginalis G3]